MKNALTVTLLLIAFVMSASVVLAETEVTVKGQVRSRTELSDRTFDVDDKVEKATWLRTRVSVEATKDDNATAFVQFQDSRILGDLTLMGKDASGGLNDGKNVDIHQAYIQIDKIWWDGFGAKIGRFEMNFGNQRVFGAVGWSNVGRTWEGVQHWYDHEKFKLTAFVVKREEERSTTGNADYDVMGLNYHNYKLGMDLFAIYDYDAEKVEVDIADLKRWSIGTYYHRVSNKMDYTLNAVMQTGTDGANDSTETDISAYLLALEVGYSLQDENKTRLAFGVDLSSGSDTSDTDIKTYNNMYYTGHKFRGYMDYFVPPFSMPGLMDIYVRAKTSPWAGWTIAADVHMFKTAQDWVGPDGLTSDVGTEIDLTIKTSSVAGVGLQWGASYFMAKDAYSEFETGNTDNDAGFWSYMQATVGF